MFEWVDALLALAVAIIVVGVLVAIVLIIAIGGLLARMWAKETAPSPWRRCKTPLQAEKQWIPPPDREWLADVLEKLPEA